MKYWPQVVMLFLMVLGLGVGLAKHGDMKIGKVNFWTTFLVALIDFGILWAGGFFRGML